MSMKTVLMVILLFMAVMSGCDKKPLEEDITPGDSYATYGDVLDNSIAIGFEEVVTDSVATDLGGTMYYDINVGGCKWLPDLEVGQVWESTEPDPFKSPRRRKIVVMRDGYVKYLYNGSVSNSVKERNFKMWFADKLIEEPMVIADPNNVHPDIMVQMPFTPPVWGKGELPADHQGFFGNDNTARLDYVQNRVLDKHAAILKIIAIRVLALEAVDPNAY